MKEELLKPSILKQSRRRFPATGSRLIGAALITVSLLVLLPLKEADPSAARFYLGWFGAWAGLVLSIWPLGSLDRARVVVSPLRLSSKSSWFAFWFAFAALFRLMAMGFEPALSDDVYRYVWDGRVTLAGADPYATSPDDEALAPLRDPLWERTAHREVESVYPPLAQAAFALAAAFPRPVLALRMLWLLFDLATCWLLFGLARRHLGTERTALLYAWNPLVVIEGVGMGHVDVFGAFWLTLAIGFGLRALDRRAPRWVAGAAGFALAAGVLVKLVPLVLIPIWVALLRSGRFALASAATLILGAAPIIMGVGVPPGLLRYGVSWEFNGLLFEPLWRLLEVSHASDGVKEMLAWTEATYGFDPGSVYPYVYPQFLAKVLLGLALLVVLSMLLWSAWRGERTRRRALALSGWTLAAATVASATLYPWYLLWLAVLLPLVPSITLLVLCTTIGFAYLPALTGASAFPTAWSWVWLPVLAAGVAEVWWRRGGKPEA